MFMPKDQKVPQEIIDAMLALSGASEERDLLKEQLALSKALISGGMGYRANAPSGFIGGLANAGAQGLQGYMGGAHMKKSMGALDELRRRSIENRGKYIQGALGTDRTTNTGSLTGTDPEDPYTYMLPQE